MIDWAHLYGLRADIGSDTFSDVIGLFLQEADEALAAMQHRGSDVPVLLHMLKGSALAVGLTDLAARCLDAERRACAGAEPQIAETIKVYDESRAALLQGLALVNLAPQGTPT